MLPNRNDDMPHQTSFDRLCCPKAVMAVTPDVVKPCVQSKGFDVMPRPASIDRVCCPREVMSCHVRLCVLFKGGDGMPRLTLSTLCAVKGR